ncbi:FMN reductase [Arsenicitalea aurantiaca]|uniref:FMN reductase n=1 Tax=Arsenicitalea aurantiaca TaxID=1783274 RepID=A0A433X441_9HYPH|nr:FMN reductase [Arsenicitalea aurantiaca]RUT28828.1 FMN reductase [Arsenicitalea aurantiaca]
MTPPRPLSIVAFSANTRRPSRSRALAGLIGQHAARHVDADLIQIDLVDAGHGLGAAYARDQLDPQARRAIEAVEKADILIAASPVYKGSYTGLFKHFFDLVDMHALAETPVVVAATGGGQRHALMVEHQMRPLFGFFGALTIPVSVYAEDASFDEEFGQTDPGILARIELAARQAAALACLSPIRKAAPGAAADGDNIVRLKG